MIFLALISREVYIFWETEIEKAEPRCPAFFKENRRVRAGGLQRKF